MRVEVLVLDFPQTRRVGRYVVSLLRQLGYRSSLRTFADAGAYFRFVADSRSRAQIGQAGLDAYFLAPSTFLKGPFTCAAFMPRTSANTNFAQFCDREIDAKASRAAALQASDPVRADELWAQVDRALVDHAVAVPIVNVRNRIFVSERVGNVQHHPLWRTLLDQLWVR